MNSNLWENAYCKCGHRIADHKVNIPQWQYCCIQTCMCQDMEPRPNNPELPLSPATEDGFKLV